ncbi:DsbA family oxidoreductase [Spirillospora albida]|uniref:DsbA family oxidoreductase n=1 Tax=Spirillospora albida TaxID=58123 RepID=UPI00068985B1|nr:DsbA family protein [Spirillospora albida]
MKVEIAHDIACVWSALGHARFRRAAEEYRAEGGELDVVYRPYRIAADAEPAEAPFGGVRALRLGPAKRADRIVRAAAEDGLIMSLDRVVAADTFHAHRLVALAAEHGRAEAMAARLFRAYYTDGLDVADPHVLRALASETGVPWSADRGTARVRAELVRTRRSYGAGVPVFRFPDGTVLAGAVSLAAMRTELRRSPPAAA